jgi:hypothetical protein
MSFKVESSIKKLNNKANTTEYTLQITTDNYEQFLFMQKIATECINGKQDVKADSETFAEHYDCEPFDYQKWLKETHINDPVPNKLTTISDCMSDIPACCVKCPNHPSNGGSGICNCAAPYLNQVTCGSYSLKNNGNGTYSTTEQNVNNSAQPSTISCNKV